MNGDWHSRPLAERPVALVTGAGIRVGSAIATALASCGYRLALHARRSANEAQALADSIGRSGGEARVFVAELTDELQTRRVVVETIAQFGRIDALVNSASIWQPRPLTETTGEDVRRHFEVNTLATFVCCQEAGLAMTRQTSGGAIVNIGDWATTRPYANYAAYFTSKGTIPTLTRTMAVELAALNPRVRVNAILPGPVLLPPSLTAEEREEAVAGTLVRREGTPEHVAHAVLFLLENDFITGACLPVDGGRTIAGA